jgi:GAF domain-containing protein
MVKNLPSAQSLAPAPRPQPNLNEAKQPAVLNADLQKAAAREQALAATVDKIRRSLDINTIFQTTTQSARQLLQAERVAIYRFCEDWSGEFVSESMVEGWELLVGSPPIVADTHLQETLGGRYRHNQAYSVDDIYQTGLKGCHIALLEQFQAKAFAIAPILQGEKLWGLLAAYQNSAPRQWQQYEVNWLAQIGTQLGIGLQQAEYLQQVQIQAAQLVQASAIQAQADHLENHPAPKRRC